ncbi:hypothetical protein [Deinococcus gobiensis]|uniref:Uncharacterized protein n=1 Tax=Deinococcus gobiensis (strain DSM 21396 / JCM 16679 / CGMCC 1.7299 / I-0) TaxID=745776 RepID=H8H2J6_DEIGI|nr:hypothetical protein [Deinococcus gobiensis]AFD27743.1 hypothetical protein DGo_PB0474 [Deinococcus gobiensis I-0]
MAQPFNYERAAAILVDAAYLGDGEAAKKWQVTTRTIQNYRAKLKTDPLLSQFFARKRARAEGNWVGELRRSLGAVLEKSRLIAEAIEPVITVEDPETGSQVQRVNMAALRTLIAAGKDLGEIALALEVLNAGDAQENPTARPGSADLEDGAPLIN